MANIEDIDEVIRGAWRPVNTFAPAGTIGASLHAAPPAARTSSPMQRRHLDGPALHCWAKKMGQKTANGMDLLSIRLLKRLPMLY